MLILASSSPRRKEILANIGYRFDCVAADADESLPDGISARDAVHELALKKAQAVFSLKGSDVVLASDTVVSLDGRILGKPSDRADAKKMLTALSGRLHSVYTGVCIISAKKCERFVSETQVEFYSLDESIIEWYLDTGEPFDKAGAYGIQGKGSVLVRRIDGDYFTVMGLPAAECFRRLADFKILPE